jgi:hypothetical protein
LIKFCGKPLLIAAELPALLHQRLAALSIPGATHRADLARQFIDPVTNRIPLNHDLFEATIKALNVVYLVQ